MPRAKAGGSAPRPPLRALAFCVFLSGATGLVYESLWMRSFGLVFGNTTDAVAMVLATFMGGLALGSLLASRRPAAFPLRAYSKVELGIAASALVTWPLLAAMPALYGALASRVDLAGTPELLGRALLASLVLLPTTVLLGATVPLVVEFLTRSGAELRSSLGRLYLLNTLGGAAGVFLGAFVLVPTMGLTRTLVAAALCNLGIGLATRRWSADLEKTDRPAAASEAAAATAQPSPPAFAVLAFASGAFSFGIEVVWTRSLVLVIGSSVYAFNLVLLAVLLGIAAGTVGYARLLPRLVRPRVWLGAAYVAAGLAAIAGLLLIGWLPDAFLALLRALPVSFAAQQAASFSLSLLVMLPVTLLLGLTFPLLAHLVETTSGQRAAGLLYAWNTAGAIFGALAADFALVRLAGLQASYALLAAALLVPGAWTLAAGLGANASRRLAAAAVAAGVAGLAATGWRPWDPVRMTAGVYKYGLEWRERPGFSLADLEAQRRILFYEEGAEAVVAVAERPGSGRRYLSINGKTDAGSGAEDVVQQKFMGHVPLFLHPAPRRVLVVGWGAGATAQAVALHPGVEGVECIEIEPAVWRAAPLFEALSGRVRADPRFRMVLRDGRNHLLRSRERWDVVVSEPSNPWLAGVANLFTREFYETVLSRLAPGGVFGQWFHYYNFEPVDVKVELRTFQNVFPHVSLWVVPPVPGPEGGTLSADLLLIGSREPHAVDWDRLRAAFAPGPLADDLRSTTVLADEAGVLAAWAMGGEDLSAYAGRSGPLNTDDRPWIEFVGPRRNAQPPAEVARQARAQYEEFARASAAPMAPLRGRGPDGPELARVLVAVAERHAEAARPGRARLALERAVATDPEQADGWEKLGGVWLDAQDYPKAEAAHRQLLRLRPKDVAALLRHGAILARLGRWGEARDALLSARRLDPKAPIDPALLEYVERQARR